VRDAWREPSLEHIAALSDDVGIAQHATLDIANRHEGYCTDDVARAFIVANIASGFDRRRDEALRLGRVYLSFLLHAQRPDGRFRNFMSYERTWLDEVGSPDSNGRALWALGHGMRHAPREAWRKICREMLERAMPSALEMRYVRARSYAALGFAHAFEALGRDARAIEAALREIGDDLAARHAACASPDWDWFEDEMTYDNARLPEALLRIGAVLGDARFADLGLRTFAFYESVVVEDGTFVPIGSDGWYPRGGRRARFAQQPLEAAAFVDAALAAEALTGNARYRRLADIGFEWFVGGNTRGAVMAFANGCYDGLEPLAINCNMGAESSLAYVASALALTRPAATDGLRLVR
jgi:hypothetical protein